MDMNLVKMGLDYTRRRKKWILLLAAFGFTGYGAYRVYHTPAVAQKRQRLFKLLGALISVADAVSDSAETVGFISKDLKQFLKSDSDEIPKSFKQISKITRSEEFSESVVRVTRALTGGILGGYQLGAANSIDGRTDNSGFTDKVFNKFFTTAGSGFASVVVGSFARNLVMAFYADGAMGIDLESTSVQRWLTLLCSDKCRALIGDCVQMFVSTAVTVYLNKTMDINTYDEIFKGLTNPNHEERVKDMLVSVCSGTVETLVKTSHEVLTSPSSNSDAGLTYSYSAIDHSPDLKKVEEELCEKETFSNELKAEEKFDEYTDSGWIGKMMSNLAVPSYRRFVLDLTGRVTFETVRSFLEFFLEKSLDGLKRSVSAVHGAVVDRSVGAVRYVTAKFSVIVSLFLSLCLHLLGGDEFLVPA
ncbi:protein PHLOEM PROTEIN 2-LIKE A10-like [Malania oleifera]|uniref:protein PHLOEM PROTEIN 2-LIKE A10-like n=1 Tax=Malania oleifera TaxID=397392 RepID=UPI0025AEBB55|nr:protein PHLOEM PROTEIN 2-LIKE A10-like [Malania oleifera]XP_057947841.1 protein PHLOEM PROTEIN 2-LIKE A10-like [Malania oleifera]